MEDAGPPGRTMLPEDRALQILATWFSPAYPVGAFSYSHGLEWAIEAGTVHHRASLESWVADLVAFGAGRSDTLMLALAWRAADPAPLAELAAALAPSEERLLETVAQGTAFARTTAAVWVIDLAPMAYPVAVGHAARRIGLPLGPTAMLLLQAFAANIVSAGVRLIPLGQTDGQRILAALMPLIECTAAEALAADPDDLGGLTMAADLASMLHETQHTRLYRS